MRGHRDVSYGVRSLLRTPGSTIVAVLTLALGISAVTVIYSVLRNVALDPFPYSRSDRLVNVVLRDGSCRIIRGPYFRSKEFLDSQEETTVFEDVVAVTIKPLTMPRRYAPRRRGGLDARAVRADSALSCLAFTFSSSGGPFAGIALKMKT